MAKISNIKRTAANIHMFAFDFEDSRYEEKLIELDGKYKVLLSRENTQEYNEALLELEKMINAGEYLVPESAMLL